MQTEIDAETETVTQTYGDAGVIVTGIESRIAAPVKVIERRMEKRTCVWLNDDGATKIAASDDRDLQVASTAPVQLAQCRNLELAHQLQNSSYPMRS